MESVGWAERAGGGSRSSTVACRNNDISFWVFKDIGSLDIPRDTFEPTMSLSSALAHRRSEAELSPCAHWLSAAVQLPNLGISKVKG